MGPDQRYSRLAPPEDSEELDGAEGEETGEEEAGEPISLSFDQLPEAQDWKDGETYQITVRQVSHDEESADFEVVDAGTLDVEEMMEDDES